jgi:copper transport protein
VRLAAAGAGLACGAAALLAAAPAAFAHARLTAAAVDAGAHAVELSFDEPVEDRLSSATLVGAHDARERLTLRAHPRPRTLVFALPRGGRAVVAYRVLSTDGHATAGVVRFDAGRSRPRMSARTAAPAIGAQRMLAGARALQYAALAIVLGGGAFFVLVWLPASACVAVAERAPLQRALALRWRRPARAATALGALSAALALGAQAAVGASSAQALGGAAAVLGTRAGAAWLLALAAWATIAVVLAASRGHPHHPRALLALGLPLAVLAVVPAMCGHAGRGPGLAAANVVHVCAISVWLGGLVALIVALRVVRARRPGRAGTAILRALADRFSAVALVAITALVVTGAAQSTLLLGAAGDLLHTSYGRLIVVKIAVTAAVLALGARQRRALARHALPADGTTRAELLLGLLALATTAVLAGEAG